MILVDKEKLVVSELKEEEEEVDEKKLEYFSLEFNEFYPNV